MFILEGKYDQDYFRVRLGSSSDKSPQTDDMNPISIADGMILFIMFCHFGAMPGNWNVLI